MDDIFNASSSLLEDVTEVAEEQVETTIDDNEPIQSSGDVSGARLALVQQLVTEARILLERISRVIGSEGTNDLSTMRQVVDSEEDDEEARVIEGVFDGQKMIGPDGHHYSVPANYASKSKLVEGDMLKLTITNRGAFVYKQIGPCERRRLLGVLTKNPLSNEWVVKVDGRNYAILTASVTYFHGHDGDEVTVLVPESGESKWAAVENIIKTR